MSKNEVAIAALAGINLDPSTVARPTRDRRVVRLLHAWSDCTDVNVAAAVRKAACVLAGQIANATGYVIAVENKAGNVLDRVEPIAMRHRRERDFGNRA